MPDFPPIPDRLRESVGELTEEELLLVNAYRKAGEKSQQAVQAILFVLNEKAVPHS